MSETTTGTTRPTRPPLTPPPPHRLPRQPVPEDVTLPRGLDAVNAWSVPTVEKAESSSGLYGQEIQARAADRDGFQRDVLPGAREAAREALLQLITHRFAADSGPVQRRQRGAEGLAAADREASAIAAAQQSLDARRVQLLAEAPPDLAAQLADVAAQAEAVQIRRTRRDECVAAFACVVAEADEAIQGVVETAGNDLLRRLSAERDAGRAALAESISGPLSRLVLIDIARGAVSHHKTYLKSQARVLLDVAADAAASKEPPEPS